MNKPRMPFYATHDMRENERARQSEEAREALQMRDILDTPSGCAVFFRQLMDAGVLDAISDKSAEVYRKAAVQEMGLSTLRRMYMAHPEATIKILNRILKEKTGNASDD